MGCSPAPASPIPEQHLWVVGVCLDRSRDVTYSRAWGRGAHSPDKPEDSSRVGKGRQLQQELAGLTPEELPPLLLHKPAAAGGIADLHITLKPISVPVASQARTGRPWGPAPTHLSASSAPELAPEPVSSDSPLCLAVPAAPKVAEVLWPHKAYGDHRFRCVLQYLQTTCGEIFNQ